MKENRSTVIAIGDDQSHLAALASGLGRKGVMCRPIHYKGDANVVPRCPDVRVILADFCLEADALSSDGSTGFGADFSTIGRLLEDRIRPAGPYRIVLWTRYVREAQALAAFLEGLRTVPRPEVVRALDKAPHLDAGGNVMDEDALMRNWRRWPGDGSVGRARWRWPVLGAISTIRKWTRWSRRYTRVVGGTSVGGWSSDVPAGYGHPQQPDEAQAVGQPAGQSGHRTRGRTVFVEHHPGRVDLRVEEIKGNDQVDDDEGRQSCSGVASTACRDGTTGTCAPPVHPPGTGAPAAQLREVLAEPGRERSASPQWHHRQELHGEADAGVTTVERETCSHLQAQSLGEAPSEQNIRHQIRTPSPCRSPRAPGRDRLLGPQGHQAQAKIHLDIAAGSADESAGSQSDFEHLWKTRYEVTP